MTNSEKLTELLYEAAKVGYSLKDKSDIEDVAFFLAAKNVIVTPESGIGDLSDGYHTFNELYHHRAVLFSVICNSCSETAWKSKLHDTGDMYEGMFIVGIETPKGQATYHYDAEPYWDIFKVKELERAPKWDGHTPQQAIERIAELRKEAVARALGYWHKDSVTGYKKCSICGAVPPGDAILEEHYESDYCPDCGAKMNARAGLTNLEKRRSRTLEEEARQIYLYEDGLNGEICKSVYEECPHGDDVEPHHCIECIKNWLVSEAKEE